jgi:hypothetical protein
VNRPVVRLAGAAASAVTLLGAAALPAFAADPSASPGTGTGAGSGILDSGQSLNGVLAFLIFGLAVIVMVLLYLFYSERQFFAALRRAASTGGGVDVTDVSAIASAAQQNRGVAAELEAGAAPAVSRVSLKVAGPGEVEVGKPVEYHAGVGMTLGPGPTPERGAML